MAGDPTVGALAGLPNYAPGLAHDRGVTTTYGAVDQSPDPQEAVAWQERLNERPAIRAYKRHTYELVAGASRVLDVGCGPGTDAAAIASGSAGPGPVGPGPAGAGSVGVASAGVASGSAGSGPVGPGPAGVGVAGSAGVASAGVASAGVASAGVASGRAGPTPAGVGAAGVGSAGAGIVGVGGTDSAGPVRVVGLDPSAVMCRAAVARGVTVCRGEARALPFADGTFDACRSDRVVQHVEDPLAAVAELVRVTRLGGRVVVADPDQESLIVQVPGVPRGVLDQVKRLRRDVGYRNGRLAGELPGVLASLGLADVDVAAFPLVLTDPAEAFGLPSWPRLWRDRGVGSWTDDDLWRWDAAIAAASAPGSGFVFALMYLVVTGVRR
jgi:ubiquinone/menaquinone biosynthesis C-methylase UbiE